MAATSHPLNSNWTLWAGDANEPDWGKKLQPLCHISTVEEFWQNYNHIPKPSVCFFDGEFKTKVGPSNKVIDDFAFFKAGVKPEWEDPTNKDHGCLQVRKALSPSQLDHYWQNLLLALIGESLDPADVIAGARVVDKGSKSGVMYRMELWLKVSEPDKVASLRERLEAVIADGTPSFSKGHPKFEWKKHNDKK